MSMSKLLITLGLILLMTTPIAVAHADSYSGSGTAVVSDAGAMSNKVTYSLSGVTVLGSESAYEGWLVNSASDEKMSTGVMKPLPDGSLNHVWTSPDGANLLEMYDTAIVTVEPVPDDDPAPSGVIAYSDTVGGGAMDHIRGLIVGNDSTINMLQSQIGMAMAKVWQAQSADSIDGVKAATEEVVAIIDADDGIMALAAAAGETAATAMDTPGEANVSMYAKQVMAASDNVQAWAAAAKEDAAAVTAQEDIEVAKTLLNVVNGKFSAAMNGVEVSNMGGASDAYVSAQKMATFTLPAPADGAVATPVTGDAYVPMAMQVMLFAALMLLIGGGAMLYRERRLDAKA